MSLFISPTIEDIWKLAPVVGWTIIHVIREYKELLKDMTFHFKIGNWRQEWYRIPTSSCVHSTWQHLAANSITYLGVMMVFRLGPNPSCWQDLPAAVIVFGCGHLSSCVALWYKGLLDRGKLQDQFGFNISILRSLVGKVHDVQRNDYTFYCGASSGVMALLGYVAVVDLHPIAALFSLIPPLQDALIFLPEFRGKELLQAKNPPDELSVVGHTGGLVAGLLLGCAWNRYRQRNSSPPPRPLPSSWGAKTPTFGRKVLSVTRIAIGIALFSFVCHQRVCKK